MIPSLQELAQLHKQGVLSDDEFTAAKAKILGIWSPAPGPRWPGGA